MLADLKEAAASGNLDEYETRFEEWVGAVRAQVDYIPGRCVTKRR